jgi:thioredoxin-related protein
VRLIVVLAMVVAALGLWSDTGRAEPSQTGVNGTEMARIARAEATSLIMVDDPACHYCRKWNKEVGGGYARTAEGQAAPLTRVRRNSKALSNFSPVVYTPTFILVRDGREVGRITGYPRPVYFWEELSALMASAGLAAKG